MITLRCVAAMALALAPLLRAQELPVFAEIAREAGLSFRHSYGDHHLDNIVEGTGSGVCVFDFDSDGFQDLYFPSGSWTRGVSDNQGRDLRGKLRNRLFRNNGKGGFTDVTDASGAGDQTFSTGCSAADYDNDGDVDLYVLNYGPNVLYRNNGDGTFTDVSKASGLDSPLWSLHAVWFDYNGDGWLDLFVANYLEYDEGKFRDFYPVQGYPGPLSYPGQPDQFYRNNGDGTFTEIAGEAGMHYPDGRAMSVTATDLDNDGRLEVFVTNDAMENYYFVPQGDGTFVDRAVETGLAYGEDGQNVASMGPAVGDVNRDGRLDVYIPDLNYCTLMIQGEHGFDYKARELGISVTMGQYTGWAPILFDYDNDGWLDIFTTHGNAHHEYVEEDTLMRNTGDGRFVDVSAQAGPYFFEKYVGRGAAALDFDNDGDVDLVIVNLNDEAKLLRNDGGNRRRWLSVEARLSLPSGSRLAIGARVTVTANGARQIEDVVPMRGYLSQWDARLHFGLGGATAADVEIRWPDGAVEKFPGVKADQFLKLERRAEIKPVKR